MKNIAIIGATGAVGEEILNVLNEYNFPVKELRLLASKNSAGKEIVWRDETYVIEELDEHSFDEEDVDIAFFCAGGSISEKYAKIAANKGALVIDNTSYFRMMNDVPLIVPECNPGDFEKHKGIIANPNCSTIQMVQVLKPLDDVFDIERVDVSTYQAASGAGNLGMSELMEGLQKVFAFEEIKPSKFTYQLALNLIPQIDVFTDSGYTKEELKMVNETQKIMNKKMQISATCVRVPVLRSHSESITITFKNNVDLTKVREILSKAPSVVLMDNPNIKAHNEDSENEELRYPMPLFTSNTNETYVGRIRVDLNNPKILHLWCVADQIRVGAATNAVRIALLSL
ncbi:aspartate-semialdehyde dehydrogenase [Campylobacter sp. RM12637]|uniref:aspartate-semialdehyde dehydrogenase n=1 Tax=Campylobacter sp. RM12637 TaxID=2735734 RepID=UPI0030143BF9|nr:aspartate-semialdehyde dehydrogenase [Campylobacter sp. RM12637]